MAADTGDPDRSTDHHFNTYIEAGVARGADTPLHVMSQVPESGKKFTRWMFWDLEVNWYRNDAERIAIAHRIARMYRRRVFLPASARRSS